MAYVRKIKGALVTQDSSEYVGEETYLFYDIETGCLRLYDGTPGGKPACGAGSGTGLDQAKITVAASATATAMAVLPQPNVGVKFLITVTNTVTGEVAASEVLGIYRDIDDSVTHSLYNKVGDKIKYLPNVVYVSPNVELTIQNNETNSLIISVTRIPTLSV
jgi:hypothetical protein